MPKLMKLENFYLNLESCEKMTLNKLNEINIKHKKKMISLRVKMGKNPYSQEFTCSKCRKEWDNDKTRKKSFFLRLEVDGMIIDFPICPKCFEEGYLLEVGNIDISKHHTSHPIYVA